MEADARILIVQFGGGCIMITQNMRRIALLLSVAALAAGSALWVAPSAFADEVVACDDLPATIVGTNGNDTLTGTAGPDVISGLGGNDTISGLDGDDIICGDDGADTIYGNVEILTLGVVSGDNDRIFGNNDGDLLIGDFRTAAVSAGAGASSNNDYIDGGEGADTISGSYIEVTITTTSATAGFSDDTLVGGDGADTIYGQGKQITFEVLGPAVSDDGHSVINSGEGADTVYGDLETLVLNGGGTMTLTNSWDDTIDVAGGNDLIYGDVKNVTGTIVPVGSGDDTIDGGSGTDTGDANFGIDTCTNTEGVANCEL